MMVAKENCMDQFLIAENWNRRHREDGTLVGVDESLYNIIKDANGHRKSMYCICWTNGRFSNYKKLDANVVECASARHCIKVVTGNKYVACDLQFNFATSTVLCN